MQCSSCKLDVDPWELREIDGNRVCIFCHDDISATSVEDVPTTCANCGGALDPFEFEANGIPEKHLFCARCYRYQVVEPNATILKTKPASSKRAKK
jgi:hypothetical protein